MPMTLAARLAAGQVTNREVAYLMLCNLVFGSIVFYGAFTWANPPWTLLSLIEFVTVVAITVAGFTKCFYAGRGENNAAFAMQFNCLSFGSWFWATALTWAAYWAGVWLFQTGVFAAYQFERIGLANNLARIGGGFEWLWTFIASVAWQLIYFSRLRHSLARANNGA